MFPRISIKMFDWEVECFKIYLERIHLKKIVQQINIIHFY